MHLCCTGGVLNVNTSTESLLSTTKITSSHQWTSCFKLPHWLCYPPHNLACKYSFLSSLLSTREYWTFCRKDVCTSENEIPYWWLGCQGKFVWFCFFWSIMVKFCVLLQQKKLKWFFLRRIFSTNTGHCFVVDSSCLHQSSNQSLNFFMSKRGMRSPQSSGLSLRFQVAGYLLLVAGEVASSHGDPTTKKVLKCNFYRFPEGIPAPQKAIFIKSTAIISGFMMITSLLKKTTTFWDTKIISFYFT